MIYFAPTATKDEKSDYSNGFVQVIYYFFLRIISNSIILDSICDPDLLILS